MAAQSPFMLLHHSAASSSAPKASQPSAGASINAGLYHSRHENQREFNVSQARTNVSSGAATSFSTASANFLGSSSGLAGSNVFLTGGYGTTSSSVRGPSVAATTQQKPLFRAPAHKHAHHLHSIPPREKSTRTLIVDHMLWVHGRTRFAQARAELGMTDRTGGPSSSSYTHRTRPENYEEEDEEGSEGEEPAALKARGGGPGHAPNDREDERLGRQDLSLARALRVRAEGLEKVVTSMLDQPPPILHPISDEEFKPTGSLSENSPILTGTHPHTLPNGVRLRLALGTIINDLFARQAPHSPYRHTHPPPSPRVTSPPPDRSTPSCPPDFPEALLPLTLISAFGKKQSPRHQRSLSSQAHSTPLFSSRSPSYLSYTQASGSPKFQSFSASGQTSSSASSSTSIAPIRQFQTGPSPFMVPGSQNNNAHNNAHHEQSAQQHSQTQKFNAPPAPPTRPFASPRTRMLYATGADPSTANSPPAFRCPRHLHTGCEICVEAKSSARPQAGNGSSTRSGAQAQGFGSSSLGATNPGITNSGLSNAAWRPTSATGERPPGGGITGWQDGSGIGTGLLRPGVRGSVLRRKVVLGNEQQQQQLQQQNAGKDEDQTTGAGNTKLSKLIPRFIRLSALVAGELGREARGEEEESNISGNISADGGDGRGGEGQEQEQVPQDESTSPGRASPTPSPRPTGPETASSPLMAPNSPKSIRSTQHQKMYDYALRPTAEWYLLLAGLLTRAVLEGYLTAGWRGLEAAECLLLVGLGMSPQDAQEGGGGAAEASKSEVGEEDAEFAQLGPDEYPSLLEAIKVLFPSFRNDGGRKGRVEEDYEMEMYERLKRFYDVPPSTPDLSTHMEDLAWQYPAEPVERAAVRFCEAIAKWRGKPELETYKKKPPHRNPSSSDPNNAFSPGAMTIESLVHSNPTSPTLSNAGVNGGRRKVLKKPSIDVYFAPLSVKEGGGFGLGLGQWSLAKGVTIGKRARESDDGPGPSKRVHT